MGCSLTFVDLLEIVLFNRPIEDELDLKDWRLLRNLTIRNFVFTDSWKQHILGRMFDELGWLLAFHSPREIIEIGGPLMARIGYFCELVNYIGLDPDPPEKLCEVNAMLDRIIPY